MIVISYAQNFEDVMLWRALQHIPKGFYIDVGANDPVVDSVTRWFYEQGWRGINVEPVQQWFDRLKADRPSDTNLQIALSDQPGEATFFDVVDTGLATLDPEVAQQHRNTGCTVRELRVPVQTLEHVVGVHAAGRDIHFLKVDVEGAERAVLAGAALHHVRPWIVLVEATAPRSSEQNHGLWEDLLISNGYECVYFDGLNRFYIAQEHPELRAAFGAPPNTFDTFMRYAEWQARSANLDYERQVKRLEDRCAHSDKQLNQLQDEFTELQSRYTGQQVEMRNYYAELSNQHAVLQEQNAEMTVHLQNCSAQRQVLQDRIAAMEYSSSWRMTAPLRSIMRVVRGHSTSVENPLHVTPELPVSEASLLATALDTVPSVQPVSMPEPVAIPAAVQASSAPAMDTDASALTEQKQAVAVDRVAADAALRHQIHSHWHLVDVFEANLPGAVQRTCALCQHTAAASEFGVLQTVCQFGGGLLRRYQCPACDVVFGPDKMLALAPEQLSQEYESHYRLYSEGDSTEQEIRAFYALHPRKDGVYLNYGAGAWSRSVQILREEGWNIVAYEPTSSAQNVPGLVVHPDHLATLRFDGIFSNNVLEHLRQPVQELRFLASLLQPGALMSHATPCYEYLYEYTRFHLFFYLGRSRNYLADHAGLDICHHTVDGHYINYVFRPRAA